MAMLLIADGSDRKRIGNKKNLLTIDELRKELRLRYERLSLIAETTNNTDLTEDKALFTTQFKGKFPNCGQIGQGDRLQD
jgi:hypothetical protein